MDRKFEFLKPTKPKTEDQKLKEEIEEETADADEPDDIDEMIELGENPDNNTVH